MIWDKNPIYADMAELVDALSSDGSGYAIRVRLSLSAPTSQNTLKYQQSYD